MRQQLETAGVVSRFDGEKDAGKISDANAQSAADQAVAREKEAQRQQDQQRHLQAKSLRFQAGSFDLFPERSKFWLGQDKQKRRTHPKLAASRGIFTDLSKH